MNAKHQHLQRYVDYIRNASKGAPLAIATFDDDWSPIGPDVRASMTKAKLIDEDGGYMILLGGE